MKANGAPEKIYLSQERDEDGYYVDLMWHKHPYKDMENIQYVRTDAFIEKATLWLTENASDYCILHNSYDTKELIEDFITAMKRE